MLRVGFLTSGGDCQALNATMRGIAKGLYELFDEVEIYGFLEGYKGLIRGNYIKMKISQVLSTRVERSSAVQDSHSSSWESQLRMVLTR